MDLESMKVPDIAVALYAKHGQSARDLLAECKLDEAKRSEVKLLLSALLSRVAGRVGSGYDV